MTKQSGQVTWQSLNSRQQDYLTAIYQADQEVEAAERSRWSRGGRPRSAEEWRWMLYATLDGHDTPVKRHLTATGQISEGTGSTLEALERRGLIAVRYDIDTYQGRPILVGREPLPAIQITRAGRKLVRESLGVTSTKPVAGTLREWHWRALASAYRIHVGAASLEDERRHHRFYHDTASGWKTWLHLRDYRPAPLADEHRLTPFGAAFYARVYPRYQALYPAIEAPKPSTPPDPFEPFVEIGQGHETCRACQGEYLVEIERVYQQARNFTWRVEEHASRIPGQVTVKYGKVEQCTCQEEEIQETSAPFLALLDRLSALNWQVSFPRHPWITYLDSLVGGLSIDRKLRWYDPELVKAKVLPLLDDTAIDDARNVVKGDMRYCSNERRGCGSIYPQGLSGGLSLRPVALTRARNESANYRPL